MITLLTIICLALAGVMMAFMDRCSTAGEFFMSILGKYQSWWLGPKTITWRNKHESKLPFSTSILVFLTDSWHFFKEMALFFIQLAFALNISIIQSLAVNSLEAAISYPLVRVLMDVLLYKVIMTGSFHIFYTNILSMNFWKNLKNFMYEMNFWKAIIVVLPLFFFWIGAAELINRLDPRYSSTDADTTFLGDILMSIVFFITLGVLAWIDFRKKNKGGNSDA